MDAHFKWPLSDKIFQGIFLNVGIVANLVSMLFIFFKLELNPYVKRILICDTFSKVMLLSVANAGFISLFVLDARGLYTCSLAILSNLASFVGSYIYPAAMSVIRYHMANQMENQQHFKMKFIWTVTLTAIGSQVLLCLTMIITVLVFNASFGPVLNTCMDHDSGHVTLIGPAMILSISISGLSIGLVFDTLMYRFVKQKRNASVQPQLAMIAWGPPLVSHGPKDKMKVTIPIQATCLGIVNLLIILTSVHFAVFYFANAGIGQYVLRGCVGVYNMIHMPLVLLLTIKSNNKKKTAGQSGISPPQELQFHE